jgi:hypothetical protein
MNHDKTISNYEIGYQQIHAQIHTVFSALPAAALVSE